MEPLATAPVGNKPFATAPFGKEPFANLLISKAASRPFFVPLPTGILVHCFHGAIQAAFDMRGGTPFTYKFGALFSYHSERLPPRLERQLANDSSALRRRSHPWPLFSTATVALLRQASIHCSSLLSLFCYAAGNARQIWASSGAARQIWDIFPASPTDLGV